jgi:hypothetical protein
LGRKFETEADSYRYLFAELKVVPQFAVVVGHTLSRMTYPKMDEILGSAILPQVCSAKTAEGVTATLRLIEFF